MSNTPELANLAELKQVIGHRLASARHAKGWTQIQLAQHVPCHFISIAFYETKHWTPSRVMVDKLVIALEIPLFELLRAPDPWEVSD